MPHILERYKKTPVVDFPTHVKDNPEVSVCIQTYNHSELIRTCLDGVLSQKTNFSYEILLGEDASTDGTREICVEYAEKYPQSIRLFLHSRDNNISINGSPTGRFNFIYNIFKASGQYLAICEGDDSWSDPLKLQKQYDFMQANPQCVLVHTNYVIQSTSETSKKYRRLPLPKYWPAPEKVLLNNYIGTMTAFIKTLELREVLESSLEQTFKWPMLDYFIWIKLVERGLFGFLNDITSIYNKRSGSLSAFDNEVKHIQFLDAVKDMQLTLLAENKSQTLQKVLTRKVHQVYYRKRFRFAVEMNNKVDAQDYFVRMKFGNKVNPMNLLKLIRVIFS